MIFNGRLSVFGGLQQIEDSMTKIFAVVQVVLIILAVAFTTYQLFLGNFEQALAPFPLLLLYYVFVIAPQKRRRQSEEHDNPEE